MSWFFDVSSNPTTLTLLLGAAIAGLAVGYATYAPSKIERSREKAKSHKSDGNRSVSAPSSSSGHSRASESQSIDTELRGYKITSDGKKTTYFNRELSEKDKKLLGDNAPKKLEPAVQRSDSTSSGSAWNSAGTWEEKNCDEWATKKIKSLLKSIHIAESGVTLFVESVKNVQGDASISLVRGKKRFIYDFSLDIDWVAKLGSAKFTGTLHVADISADCSYEFTNSSASSSSALIQKLTSSDSCGIRRAVSDALDEFKEAFISEKK